MIEIDNAVVDTVRAASQPSDLYPSLQAALMLEHATIPLYLTALYSLVPGTNQAAANVLRLTARDEMLHFTIGANVLNALGGHPEIDHKDAVPAYPGTLPMGIAGGLQVELKPMSIDQCRVFMTIEEPDVPIARRPHPDQTTIGDFYAAMIDKIRELGSDAFQSPSAPPVTSGFAQLEPITNADSAIRGLQLIVEQGEGTRSSPFEGAGDNQLAHFYRFAEIVHGAKLVADPTALGGFSYTGPQVTFDASAVIKLAKPAALASLTDPGEATALQLATTFCGSYRRLLTALQQAFSGHPETIGTAIGLMTRDLRTAARNMVNTPDPNDPNLRLTPSWEYLADPPPT